MASLLDRLTELVTPDIVGNVASRIGESDVSVATGLRTALGSLLAGLAARSDDPRVMGQVYELASTRDVDIGGRGDLTRVLQGMTDGTAASSLGSTLLSVLFGERTSGITDVVSRAAGFNKPGSGSSILALAAPIVLGILGQRIRDRGLGRAGFAQLLQSQRDGILAAAPAGLLRLVNTWPESARVGWARTAAAQPVTAPRVIIPEPSRGNRWLWPVVGAVAALALFWALFSRGPIPEPVVAVGDSAAVMARSTFDTAMGAARTALDTGAGAVRTAAGTVSGSLRDLGAFARRTLPGGASLNIPERGIESRLISFIEDRSRGVNDTTWFDFDRLNFATGSATILPESQEQLDNIARVLEAYPEVMVKIGGYTDNTGDPGANMRLSEARAESVRQALVGKGVAATRMTAEGYGEQHPVADNATEAGRARNRRIALRVTEK